MAGVGETLKRYVFWTYERGSLHYDVMVTIILAFIFITPRFVDFRDKPQTRAAHPTGILASAEADGSAVYTVDASLVTAAGDLRQQLQAAVESVAGPVKVLDYSAQVEADGKVYAYKVHAKRL